MSKVALAATALLAGCLVDNGMSMLPPPPGDIDRAGYVPGPIVLDATLPECLGTLLDKGEYALCHEDDWLVARWASYRLSAADLQGSAERTDDFRADPELPMGGRAELTDYEGSGFDRGHLAPAADFTRSVAAMSETFVLSNMAPQWPGLNRGPWRSVEGFVRTRTAEAGEAKVLTGCLFLDESGQPSEPALRIGSSGVAVPTHIFKVVVARYADETGKGFAFLGVNDADPGAWTTFRTSIDAVEAVSGLDFFAELPDADEAALEADEDG